MHPMPKEYEDKVKDLLKVLQEKVNSKIIMIKFLIHLYLFFIFFLRFVKMVHG